MTQPEGTVTTSYDQNGFVAGVSDWRGDSIVMSNDADGRMLNAERSNGVDTNYWYDDAGRLTGVDHLNAAGPIDGFQYMLDGNGNRTMVASNAGSESYTLDALNRVTAASYPGGLTEAFVYDPAGNRTSHTKTDGTTVGYTVDATGQLISDSTGTTYTYDAAGNLTATSDGDSYSYDDYGRTVAVTSDGVTASFGYDAANVRVSVNGEAQLWDRNGGLPTLISTQPATTMSTPQALLVMAMTGSSPTPSAASVPPSTRRVRRWGRRTSPCSANNSPEPEASDSRANNKTQAGSLGVFHRWVFVVENLRDPLC